MNKDSWGLGNRNIEGDKTDRRATRYRRPWRRTHSPVGPASTMSDTAGKPVTTTASEGSRTRAWLSRVEGERRHLTTRGTWLDSASSTCTGTSVRESGLSSFEPHTPGDSDTSSTQPVLPPAKIRQRRKSNRTIGKHGQVWKKKRLER